MRWPILNRIFSTIVFYFGWIFCLYEASTGHCLYGFLLIVSFIAYSLYFSSCRKADLLLMGFILLTGPLSDLLYVQLGLFDYQGQCQLVSWVPPLWVFSLWGLFGANIHLFSWLHHRWFLAMVLGALGGPLSYLSVVRLGGVILLEPLSLSLITIGFIWAFFFPLVIWLNDYLYEKFQSAI